MNRRTIIVWGIIVGIAIIGMVATYILLGNNGFSDNVNTENQNNITSNINTRSTLLPNESEISNVEQGQGSVDDYPAIPTSLQSQLPQPISSGLIDYFYSKELGVVFSYESIAIGSDKYIDVSPESKIIYLHIFEEPKESGQSIEIINVPAEQRFNEISDIILNVVLNEAQRQECTVKQDNTKYRIIAKDTSLQDSTRICGPYAKGDNRFFVKPIEEGTATNKLVFVSAGDKELSFDGSFQGKYWYESVVVE